MTLIVGQVETILPELLEAMEQVKSATAEVDRLKSQLIALIESPQTVKTAGVQLHSTTEDARSWVRIGRGEQYAYITLLKDSGSVGDPPFITVRKSDR